MNKIDYTLVGIIIGFAMCMLTLILTGVVAT